MVTDIVLTVEVIFSPAARQVKERRLTLPGGSRVIDAVRQSGLLTQESDELVDTLALAIDGRKVRENHLLQHGDRVEILRPLLVDPKIARRERFVKQGVGRSGLFAKRRPNSKSGY